MGKIALFEGAPQVFFTKENKDLAILSIDSTNMQPLKFRVEENGTYTLHFELKDLSLPYLHLIDNITGGNIDLLATPDYTFSANTNNYTSHKMAKFCAYQERCVKDVKDKLKTYDIAEKEKNIILEYLLDNRFVNDERFAKSFVRGKVNQSGWGVNKIRFHLIQKGIDKDIIEEALGQTDEEAYRQRLIEILKAKAKTVKAASDYEKKRKLAAYAMQKGFEGSLIWEVLKEFDI